MLKLTTMVILVMAFTVSTAVEANKEEVWFRWEPLMNNTDFAGSLYKCILGTDNCTDDHEAMKVVLTEDKCNNCQNCCEFKRGMVQGIRKRIQQLKNKDVYDFIKCEDSH